MAIFVTEEYLGWQERKTFETDFVMVGRTEKCRIVRELKLFISYFLASWLRLTPNEAVSVHPSVFSFNELEKVKVEMESTFWSIADPLNSHAVDIAMYPA